MNGTWEFMHPNFQRGRRELLSKIKRRKDRFSSKHGRVPTNVDRFKGFKREMELVSEGLRKVDNKVNDITAMILSAYSNVGTFARHALVKEGGVHDPYPASTVTPPTVAFQEPPMDYGVRQEQTLFEEERHQPRPRYHHVRISPQRRQERVRDEEINCLGIAHGDLPTLRMPEVRSDYQQQEDQNPCEVLHTYAYANWDVNPKFGGVIACSGGPLPITMNSSFSIGRDRNNSRGKVQRAFRIKPQGTGKTPAAWNGAATRRFEGESFPAPGPGPQNAPGTRAPFFWRCGYPPSSPGGQGAKRQSTNTQGAYIRGQRGPD